MEEVTPARSSVIRLRGLPYAATIKDIEVFFDGFSPGEVHICSRNGRRARSETREPDAPRSLPSCAMAVISSRSLMCAPFRRRTPPCRRPRDGRGVRSVRV